MWAYKYARKETRLQVPKFKNFMKQNHDLLKLWYEDTQEQLEERIGFLLRCLRFLTGFLILFLAVYLIIDPRDNYYNEECNKRTECYSACNHAFFPQLECHSVPDITLIYYNNLYPNFYLFKRPNISLSQSGV